MIARAARPALVAALVLRALSLSGERAAAQPEPGANAVDEDADAALGARLARYESDVARGSIRDLALAVAERAAGDLDAGRTAIAVRADATVDARGLTAALSPVLARALAVYAPAAAPFRVAESRDSVEATAAAAARAGDARTVDVRISLRSRSVRIEGAVFAARDGALASVYAPAPERLSTFVLERPLGADLTRWFGAPPRVDAESISAVSMALPARGYAALVATDLDGDGTNELVLARDERVEAVRLRSARGASAVAVARPVGSASLRAIPPATAPSRRSFGTVVPVDAGALFRLSDHRGAFRAVRLVGRRIEIDPAPASPCADPLAFPLEDACASFVTGRDWLSAELTGRDGAPPPPALPAGFYARASRTVRQPDGSDVTYEALVTPRGRLGTRVGERRTGLADVGAALAMADLDADGSPELLVSSSRAIGEGDVLRVLRLRPDGALLSVWESPPLTGSVLLAGAGDLDGDGAPELLAVEEPAPGASEPARLWVVR